MSLIIVLLVSIETIATVYGDHHHPRAVREINTALNVTCLNGGSVIEGRCHCLPRFEGSQCQNEPCLNGGRKMNVLGKCHCPYGVKGSRCETISQCSPGNGELIEGRCVCKKQWAGIFCQHRTCHNGQYDMNEGICICDLGFSGPFCEIAIVCVHGELSPENECVCEPNWSNPECDSCSHPYQLVGSDCLLLHSETKEAIGSAKVTFFLPYLMLGCGALVLLAVAVTSIALISKRFHQKPSRVSSTEETAHV